MLKFQSKTLPGTLGSVLYAGPESRVVRTPYAGVDGESEIRAGHGGRDVVLELTIHDEYDTFAKLHNKGIKPIEAVINETGTLRIDSGGVKLVLKDCTLDVFQPIPLPGQPTPEALLDVAGTLDGGWFQTFQLRFRQLLVFP